MAAEIKSIRDKARRAKDLALTRAIHVMENPSSVTPEVYDNTYQTILKNSVPRTQEITGEEGERLLIPIYGGLSKHDSNGESIQPKEEN